MLELCSIISGLRGKGKKSFIISFNTILPQITYFRQKKKKRLFFLIPPPAVSLSSVDFVHGKLNVLKMDINSEANWKKKLIENKKKSNI